MDGLGSAIGAIVYRRSLPEPEGSG
jgi:hypothetical protein